MGLGSNLYRIESKTYYSQQNEFQSGGDMEH